MTEPTDESLLRAWQAGDVDAGNVLVRRHFSTLYRFFRSRLDHNVADLVQRTFLACVEARDRFPDDADFRTYALGIARNQMLMALRKMHRAARVLETGHATGRAGGASPSEAVAHRQQQRQLLAALRRLPLDLQLLLELYYWEELRLPQIATILEIPHGTVKSRLHRARARLMQELERLDLDEDAVTSTLRGLEKWAAQLRAERETSVG
jgi:RNA polymerase sigma-70 factor (ECF subfamily)